MTKVDEKLRIVQKFKGKAPLFLRKVRETYTPIIEQSGHVLILQGILE